MAEELLEIVFVTFLDGSVEEVRGHYIMEFVEGSAVFRWGDGSSFLVPLRNVKYMRKPPRGE